MMPAATDSNIFDIQNIGNAGVFDRGFKNIITDATNPMTTDNKAIIKVNADFSFFFLSSISSFLPVIPGRYQPNCTPKADTASRKPGSSQIISVHDERRGGVITKQFICHGDDIFIRIKLIPVYSGVGGIISTHTRPVMADM